MIFFITGASSFIGLELCRYLSDNGHKVIAMTRKKNIVLEEIAKNGNLQVYTADLQNVQACASSVTADVFIHLAWAGTTHEERNNPEIHKKNVGFSLECVRLAKQMGCKLYVDAGSQAEYGIVPGEISEDTPCHPFSEYGKGKLEMFRSSCFLTEQLGLKYIHLRIFSVYGENDHENTLIMSSMQKLRLGETVSLRSGGQKWNYVYVKDAARQIAELSIQAIRDGGFIREVYNISSNDTRDLKDFVISMKEISGSSSELIFGGYNPENDVNLNPDTTKTSSVVKPLTMWSFEQVIQQMV